MKIIFYNDDHDILDIIEDAENVEIDETEKSIRWNWGQALGTNAYFYVVDNEATDLKEENFRGRKITAEMGKNDKSQEFKKRNMFSIEEEIRQLKAEVADVRRIASNQRPQQQTPPGGE